MKYEGITFKVKEYDEFPFKKDNDDVIAEFPDLETAQFECKWYMGRAKYGERYYVMDEPHKWIVAPNELEAKWTEAKRICGLIK